MLKSKNRGKTRREVLTYRSSISRSHVCILMLTRWAGATTSGACRRLRGLGRGGDYRIARNRCKKYQTVQFSRSPAELYLYEQKTSTGTSSSTSQWPTRLKGKTRTAKHDLNSTLSIICQVDGGLFTPGGPEAGTGTAPGTPAPPGPAPRPRCGHRRWPEEGHGENRMS